MCASTFRRESAAGMAALVGSPMPSASTMLAMVDAVPMVMQLPTERDMHASASMNSCMSISPLRTMASNFHTWVPEPICSSRKRPFNIGPPDTAMVGRSQLAAPMSSSPAGVEISSGRPSKGATSPLSNRSSSPNIRANTVPRTP